ncbi:MAG TPA: PIN domain-containing protein [Tepidiformaceae bacterium]|nr:PIN domain-containing protein [Tepidiformaceae bacterium]
MRLLVDAAPLVAQVEPENPLREAAMQVLLRERELPILSPLTAAEADYLCQRRAGPRGNLRLITDLAAGRFEVPHLAASDFAQVETLNNRYRELNAGMADLSIVVLAARYNTTRILTFDHRHFRLITPLHGGTFTLLPFDEPAS